MNEDPFESMLHQPFRALPTEWKSGILRAAQPLPTASRREWLWPSPLVWAAMALFWTGLLLSSLGARETNSPPLGAAEVRQFLLHRADLSLACSL